MFDEVKTQNNQIIEDVWGDICFECSCERKPVVHRFHLKHETVILMSCSNCDFSIVVVELDSPDSSSFTPQKDKSKPLVATHSSL